MAYGNDHTYLSQTTKVNQKHEHMQTCKAHASCPNVGYARPAFDMYSFFIAADKEHSKHLTRLIHCKLEMYLNACSNSIITVAIYPNVK